MTTKSSEFYTRTAQPPNYFFSVFFTLGLQADFGLIRTPEFVRPFMTIDKGSSKCTWRMRSSSYSAGRLSR